MKTKKFQQYIEKRLDKSEIAKIEKIAKLEKEFLNEEEGGMSVLEIKSEWSIWSDDEGEMFPVFHLYMKRKKENFNCSMVANNFDDGDNVLSCLISMITNLVHEAYPQMKDPLFKANKRLESLEESIEKLKLHITVLESEKNNEST